MSLTSRKDFSLSVGTLTNARSFGKRGWYLLLMHSSPPTPRIGVSAAALLAALPVPREHGTDSD